MSAQDTIRIPGGWEHHDAPHADHNISKESSDAVPHTLGSVVNKAGEIVDNQGRSVARLTEPHDAESLAGKSVTSAQDVVDPAGDAVGKPSRDSGYTTRSNAEDASQEEKSLPDKTEQTGESVNNAGQNEQQPQVLEDQAQEPIDLRDDDDPVANEDAKSIKSSAHKDASISGHARTETGKPPSSLDKQPESGMETPKQDQDESAEHLVQSPASLDEASRGGVDASNKSQEEREETQVAQQDVDKQDHDLEPEKDNQDIIHQETDKQDVVEPEEDKDHDVEQEKEEQDDLSILKNTKVNKGGNLVDEKGNAIGRLVQGDAKHLQGRTADEKGNIWSDSGKIVGKAELIPEAERQGEKAFAPFENFPDAIVEADGRVTSDGKQVGTVVEGDAKHLKGSRVDEDGDVVDRRGNVVGRAEPWDEPEEEATPEIDRSVLAGKRVNKAGNVVDSAGTIYGRVIEGNVNSLVGRMCNKHGHVMSESGDVIGKAELVPEHQREGSKEGPFAELVGCTVTRDAKVVTASGDVVGRLTSGDAKTLYGRSVDQDGDVVDGNGNVLGKAERWEEPVVEQRKNMLAGRRVNRQGDVVDEDGNIIAKLVSGDAAICAGMEVDQDGDVVNSKGSTIGHVSMLQDVPDAEPTESPEEKETREQVEKDQKLAGQLAAAIEQSLDKIRPICSMITDKIDRAERTPKDELDEEQLVREVKPLIEEGGKILTETNGIIRGLDPDGRIQRNAKHKAGTRDASPEEHHLAELLKELTGTVSQTVDNAKRKIDGMPHAKKELNPLWGLLSEPLFQILAAVGLLLNGVLGLVGRLLSGLGLGGLVDHLLGALGLNKILGSLGLGGALDALTGKKKK